MMNNKNFFGFIFLLTLILLSLNASALNYRTDVNNGTWTDYKDGLDSVYYIPDSYKTIHNRDFEFPFNLNISECNDYFCFLPIQRTCAGYGGSCSSNAKQNTTYFLDGQGALNIHMHSSTYGTGGKEEQTNIFIPNFENSENVEGRYISFYIDKILNNFENSSCYTKAHPCYFHYGYVDDSNNFFKVGEISNPVYYGNTSAFPLDFQKIVYHIPDGNNYRFAFKIHVAVPYAGSFGYNSAMGVLIDNITITGTNVGTFFKGSFAPSCSTISNCSNVTSASDLKSNDTRDLYWVVDYVDGATCIVMENGILKGNMTKMSSGMYYYKIESKAYPSDDIDITLQAECSKIPYMTKGFYASPRIFNDVNIQTTIQTGNSLVNNKGYRGDLVTFWSKYYDDLGQPITDANCTLTIDGSTNTMTYNSSRGRYEYQKGFITDHTYPTTHTCTKGNYASQSESYNVLMGTLVVENVTFVPIHNSSDYNLFDGNVTINNSFTGGDIIFSIVASETATAEIVWRNAKDSLQYFVYSSTDGNNWVFNDTLTFGATNSTPVQKIWNTITKEYDYSVNLNISTTKVYYKLVYQAPAYYRELINSSSDWVHQSHISTISIPSGKNLDIFSDSNYTNIQTYTMSKYQNLVSDDLDVGYELQFTAYAVESGNLWVGVRPLVGEDVVSSITVTTIPTRFSIPISPASRDAQLLIKSTNVTSNTFYVTDYAIVPRSYFVGQLEVKNVDYTNLSAILHGDGLGNMVSYIYVKEGQPARLQTSFYDTSGDLDKIEIQTLIESTVVQTQYINMSSYAGNFYNFSQVVEGVIDLNGIGGDLDNTKPLRIITYKTILWNKSGLAVSEQSNTVALLQFPFFPNDFKLNVEVGRPKLGTNPKVTVTIRNAVPENLLGLKFSFYSPYFSINTPNYSEVIYAKDLGCTTLASCTREIVFDGSKQSKGFVWDTLGDYTVHVSALLSTENPNYVDSYANVTKKVKVTESGYDLLQMIQYMERHQNATNHTPYNSTEKIPLMLGVVDDAKKNLSDVIVPYFTITVNGVPQTTAFYPDAFRFDETSGTNIWLFNQYLYNDNGSLLDHDDVVQFSGKIVDLKLTQSTDSNFGFANRCTTYPIDFVGDFVGGIADAWNGSIGADIFNWKIDKDSNTLASQLTNLYGSFAGSLYLNGCIEFPDNVVRSGSIYDTNITIDDSFPVYNYADNRQALYCGQKVDNNSVVDKMGDEFGCVLLIHEDLQQIDGVTFQIGNENSDYSITNENRQYLDFTITDNDIMFSDTQALLRGWFHKGYLGASPTGSPTVQDFIYSVYKDIFTPNLTTEQIASQYRFTELLGGGTRQINDVNTVYNFKTDFNSNVYNKAVFFKISGLSVINAYDYLTDDQRNSFDTSTFLSYARENNFPVYPKKMTITLYNNSTSKPMKIIETTSPLIINYAPSVNQQVMDVNGNITYATLPQILPLRLISTMYSANSTISSRLSANLQFLQIIKANPFNLNGNDTPFSIPDVSKGLNDFFFGKDDFGNDTGLVTNPIGFIANPVHIAIMFLIIGLVLIFSLVLKNISSLVRK